MKKFFGKLPVMITFVALAVIFAAVYIGMLVRPVAIGMTYKGEMDLGYGGKMEMVVKVTSSSKVDVKVKVSGTSMEMEDVRYIEHDRQLLILLDDGGEPLQMTDKEYKDAKEEIIKNWDEVKKSDMMIMDINAFSMGDEEQSLDCTGSVVFAIVGGIVELILLAGAGLAVFYKVKK